MFSVFICIKFCTGQSSVFPDVDTSMYMVEI